MGIFSTRFYSLVTLKDMSILTNMSLIFSHPSATCHACECPSPPAAVYWFFMLMIWMQCPMLVKYNANTFFWILWVIDVPYMPSVPGHNGHIRIIQYLLYGPTFPLTLPLKNIFFCFFNRSLSDAAFTL